MTNRSNAPVRRSGGSAAAVLATLLAFGATAANAHIPEQDGADARQVEVSAGEAKRLVRRFLVDSGYAIKPGPGGARIRSITREGDTWAVRVDLRPVSLRRERATLYVDAYSGHLTDVAPQDPPTVAAE